MHTITKLDFNSLASQPFLPAWRAGWRDLIGLLVACEKRSRARDMKRFHSFARRPSCDPIETYTGRGAKIYIPAPGRRVSNRVQTLCELTWLWGSGLWEHKHTKFYTKGLENEGYLAWTRLEGDYRIREVSAEICIHSACACDVWIGNCNFDRWM